MEPVYKDYVSKSEAKSFFDNFDESKISKDYNNEALSKIKDEILIHSKVFGQAENEIDAKYLDKSITLLNKISNIFNSRIKINIIDDYNPARAFLEEKLEKIDAEISSSSYYPFIQKQMVFFDIIGEYNFEKNDKKVYSLLMNFAKNGNAVAEYFLGVMDEVDYDLARSSFIGVRKVNENDFIQRYEKSASKGNRNALYALALHAKTTKLQDFYLEKAAKRGHLIAMHKLGEKYYNRGDMNTALRFYKMAFDHGNSSSAKEIGKVYEDWGDYNLALQWYSKIPYIVERETYINRIMGDPNINPPWDEIDEI